MRKLFYLILIAGIFTACGSNEKPSENNETSYQDALNRMNQTYNTIVVQEVIQTDNYTYIRYTHNNEENWGAVAARPIEVGKTYYFREAMEMKNFESKSLERVFPSIWFINDFSEESPEKKTSTKSKGTNLAENHHKADDVHEQIEVDKAKGGYSLAEIFEQKSSLKNQEVTVRGQVVKINKEIMKTNWVHIQDGTSFNNLFDLTITTKDAINFEVGDIITFKGKLSLNKDFGYGYKYDYLIEDAHIQ